jgi:hypothetical protein
MSQYIFTLSRTRLLDLLSRITKCPPNKRNADAEKHQASGCQFQPQLSMVYNTRQCIASAMTHNHEQNQLLNSTRKIFLILCTLIIHSVLNHSTLKQSYIGHQASEHIHPDPHGHQNTIRQQTKLLKCTFLDPTVSTTVT